MRDQNERGSEMVQDNTCSNQTAGWMNPSAEEILSAMRKMSSKKRPEMSSKPDNSDAPSKKHKMCEVCKIKHPSFSVRGDEKRRRRWCSSCAQQIPNAVNLRIQEKAMQQTD
eukprot:SAG31_NODE_34193_length_335_cov_1.275424_1_plen_111_part_11